MVAIRGTVADAARASAPALPVGGGPSADRSPAAVSDRPITGIAVGLRAPASRACLAGRRRRPVRGPSAERRGASSCGRATPGGAARRSVRLRGSASVRVRPADGRRSARARLARDRASWFDVDARFCVGLAPAVARRVLARQNASVELAVVLVDDVRARSRSVSVSRASIAKSFGVGSVGRGPVRPRALRASGDRARSRSRMTCSRIRFGIAARISSGISSPRCAALRPTFESLRDVRARARSARSVRRQYELYEPNFCWSVANR